MAVTSTNSSPAMKIAMPNCVSAVSVGTVFDIASARIAEHKKFRLLLDMSSVHQIEQDGLNKLYDLTQLMKSSGSPKIIIRRPNRVIRDALILSNTTSLFEIWEDA